MEFKPIQNWFLDRENSASFELSADINNDAGSDWIGIYKVSFFQFNHNLNDANIFVVKNRVIIWPEVANGAKLFLNRFGRAFELNINLKNFKREAHNTEYKLNLILQNPVELTEKPIKISHFIGRSS